MEWNNKSETELDNGINVQRNALLLDIFNKFNMLSKQSCLSESTLLVKKLATDFLESSESTRDCNSPETVSGNSININYSPTIREHVATISDCYAKAKRSPSESTRPKQCKEKDCNFVTYDTNEYWTHKATVHAAEYSYVCPYDHCKFLTKYKHHMNHHLLSKHEKNKRFICDYENCTYKCVTKSMLVSHQKSHWIHYPYHCGSCFYKSKFLNAYKRHLRYTKHKHGLVFDKSGMPDLNTVIDVYGTRRGPRQTATVTSRERLDSPINLINPWNSQRSKIIDEKASCSGQYRLRTAESSATDINNDANNTFRDPVFRNMAYLLASTHAVTENTNLPGNLGITDLPAPKENESTDKPLDLRVFEATHRKNDQS